MYLDSDSYTNYSSKQAENIVFTLEQTMLFFARVVGKFELHDKISPIKIDNFD